jgi:sphingomyelin synthase-related protein 1
VEGGEVWGGEIFFLVNFFLGLIMADTSPKPPVTRQYCIFLKSNIFAEFCLLKRPLVFGLIIFGAVMQWIHNIAHNYVFYLADYYGVYGGPENQLVDLGFEAFKGELADYDFLPSNGLLYTLASLGAIVAFSPVFTDKIIRSGKILSTQIFWRTLIVISITVVFRCVSFLITILPSPAPQCSKENWDPPTSVSDILWTLDTENGCSDLIFSSHMMYGISAAFVVTMYLLKDLALMKEAGKDIWKYELHVKYSVIVACWLMVIAEGLCIIAQDRHYSVDVWTALYAVPLTWIAFNHFFPSDPVAKQLDDAPPTIESV